MKSKNLHAEVTPHMTFGLTRKTRDGGEEKFDVSRWVRLVEVLILRVVDVIDINDGWLALYI